MRPGERALGLRRRPGGERSTSRLVSGASVGGVPCSRSLKPARLCAGLMSSGGLDVSDDSQPSPVADLLRKRRFLTRSACGLKRSVSVKRTALDKSIGLSDGGSSSHTDAPASRLARQRKRARRMSEMMLRGISVGGAPGRLAITSRVIGRATSSGAGSLTTSTLHCKSALATRSKAVRTPRSPRLAKPSPPML